jgi:sulfofructosephosphate aldolase
MLALDQRESLRTIIADATDRAPAEVPDDELRRFKVAAANALTPVASAVLLDVDHGLGPARAAGAIAAGCGVIVAADRLRQATGEPVEDTDLDERVEPRSLAGSGVDALKLLVLWRPASGSGRGRSATERVERLAERFIAAAHGAGLAAVLEPVVRLPEGGTEADREQAIVDAAAALGGLGADLYKAEVPLRGRGPQDAIALRADAITRRVRGPWVVLSQGVDAADFPRAVEGACRGGASGFLAGRAVWTDSIRGTGPIDPADLASRLETVARPRLEALAAIVDRVGRPWPEATR